MPLLEEIGLLWQTDTISPAHEHFISYLIRQKIILNSEKLQFLEATRQDKVFVLSLPLNEIHELGLMYLHYEIISKGHKVIYLGESMPIGNLKEIKKYYSSIVYVSYFTVQPEMRLVNEYVSVMSSQLLGDQSEIWLIGKMTQYIDQKLLPVGVKVFNSIPDLIEMV